MHLQLVETCEDNYFLLVANHVAGLLNEGQVTVEHSVSAGCSTPLPASP